MSLNDSISIAHALSRLKQTVYAECETGLLNSEKDALYAKLSENVDLLEHNDFILFLEHALFVADNKYNRNPIYKAIKNCIYDCIV